MDPHFEGALGENYMKQLPEITKFILNLYHSWAWEWLHVAFFFIMIAVFFLRNSWVAAILSMVSILCVMALPTVTFMAFWAGDSMLVKALWQSAKAKGLVQ